MTSDPEVRLAVARLRRAVRIAQAARGFASATVVLAGAALAAVLVARLFGVGLVPDGLWALGLLPGLGFAIFRARVVPDGASLAAHLDRRAGGAGLLLAAAEVDAGGWRAELDTHLQEARRRRHRAQVGRDALRVAAACSAVAALGWLPQKAPLPPEPPGSALARAVDAAGAELELALESGLLEAATAGELAEQAEDLRTRLLAGDPLAWGDVDAFEERLDAELATRVAAARGLHALADKLAQDPAAADEALRAELGRLAERAAELGVLDALPEELRETLAQLEERAAVAQRSGDDARGAGAGAATAADHERLQRLAAALKQQSGTRLEHARAALQQAGRHGDPLRRLLDEHGIGTGAGAATPMPVAGGADGFDPTAQGGGDGRPGRDGVGRGRADATLESTHTMAVDTAALRAERLPEGAAIPDRWETASIAPGEPENSPERPAAAGPRSGAPALGDVTFRRDLAPRHREAVRRFFSADGRSSR